MEIVYIIGNGFDLNLGLKTGYSDFIGHYKNIPNSDKTIMSFKNHMRDNPENWGNLELLLGEYTDKLDSSTEIRTLIDDLTISLENYLTEVEREFNPETAYADKFGKDLKEPEEYLKNLVHKDEIKRFI